MNEEHTRRCANPQCRVKTYAAGNSLPLTTCPICSTVGIIVNREST